jgi:hypothetical protein
MKDRDSYFTLVPLLCLAMALWLGSADDASAYTRWGNGCTDCHSSFKDAGSTKLGNAWLDDKHDVHRREMMAFSAAPAMLRTVTIRCSIPPEASRIYPASAVWAATASILGQTSQITPSGARASGPTTPIPTSEPTMVDCSASTVTTTIRHRQVRTPYPCTTEEPTSTSSTPAI